MTSRRATALVSFIAVVAIAQVIVEDVIVFLGATGAADPGVLTSPLLLIGLPFVLFLLVAGAVFAWALTGETTRR